MEQVTELLHSELVGVDEMVNSYEKRIANLQAQLTEKQIQLAEKDKTIAKLSQVCSQFHIMAFSTNMGNFEYVLEIIYFI